MFNTILNIKRFFTSPSFKNESSDIYRKSKFALETNYLNKPTAEATNLLASGVADIISSITGVRNASMRIGVILVIKTTDEEGEKIITETLSPEIASLFDKNPQWIGNPINTLSVLQQLQTQERDNNYLNNDSS